MNRKPGLHKEKLTPELLAELADEYRGGRLSSLDIKQLAKGRRWNAKYVVSPHSLSTAANYQARQSGANLLLSLVTDLTEKQIKSMKMTMNTDNSRYGLFYTVTVKAPTEAELAEDVTLDA